ncbi:hypothetical protein FRB90_011605 [Tulasnella sp. 427]|nr:hypothetical protein FRB90_011605 [Tulasnella sp. 427]
MPGESASDVTNFKLSIWSQIPVELEIQIFKLSLPEEQSYGYQYYYYSHLVYLRLVCKGWRDVIETNPTFWPFVTTYMGPRRVDKILRSSENGGRLDVYHDGTSRMSSPSHSSDVLIANISRFPESLRSLVLSNHSIDRCRALLSSPVPFLKHLTLTDITLRGGAESLNFDLFQNAATQLETLILRRSAFRWRFNVGTQLRYIEIDENDSFFNFGDGFVDVLRSSPRLATLIIRSCVADIPPSALATPIHLPELNKIQIEYCPHLSSTLLQAIVCPPPATVAVTETVDTLIMPHRSVSAALDHASAGSDANPSLFTSCGRAVCAKYGNVSIMLNASGVFSKSAQLAFFSAFFRRFSAVDRSTSTELRLEWRLEWDFASFIDLVDELFPNISHLELTCRAYASRYEQPLRQFADALASPYSNEEGSRWLLPSLETLSICWAQAPDDWVKEIIEIVRSRRETSGNHQDPHSPPPRRLVSLRLDDCLIPKKDATLLRDLLQGNLDVDEGWETDDSDEEDNSVSSVPVQLSYSLTLDP